MHTGILIQAHEPIRSASIEAMGSVEKMMELKEKSEVRVQELINSGVATRNLPSNIIPAYPTFHLLIVTPDKAFAIQQQIGMHHTSREVWELTQDVGLVERY
mgnify:FL=1